MTEFAPQTEPQVTVRPALLADAESLSLLSRRLLEYERSITEPAGELNPWASSPEELRKQLQQPSVRFFVAEVEGVLAGYVKTVVYGQRIDRRQVGWILWLEDLFETTARRLFRFLLQRPRPGSKVTAGYIAGAYVRPDMRRHGVGRILVATAENWFRGQGIRLCELHVLYNNETARQFWTEIGFEPLAMGMRKKL
ncbi:MAG: N-acetyltransferase family protein [Blastocatellia bacterium]